MERRWHGMTNKDEIVRKLEEVYEYLPNHHEHHSGSELALMILSVKNALNFIQQQNPVSCKDCVYMSSPDGYSEYCKHLQKFVTENWFCADCTKRSK